jgi:hypothetical protein
LGFGRERERDERDGGFCFLVLSALFLGSYFLLPPPFLLPSSLGIESMGFGLCSFSYELRIESIRLLSNPFKAQETNKHFKPNQMFYYNQSIN